MGYAAESRGMAWKGIVLSLVFLFLPRMDAWAATFELGLGAWQQSPEGNVAYTYNMADIATNTAEGVVHDLFPCLDDSLLEQLAGRLHNTVNDLIPGVNPDALVDRIFTRTDSLDFEDDCQFDPVIRPSGRLKVLVSPFVNFSLMATPIEFSGTGVKALGFVFLDERFAADTPFYSKIRLTHYDLAYFIDLPELPVTETWKMHAELGLDVRVVMFYAAISQNDTGLAASAEYTVPLPLLYLGIQFKKGEDLSLETETRGLYYKDNQTYSLIGRVRMHIKGPLHLAAGYRQDVIKFEVNDIDSDGTFAGPFMETVFVF